MKKNILNILLLVAFFSVNGVAQNTDSIGVKKSFQTVEICGGISPKAYRKYVTSSKGYIMYGFWYDYSRNIKNNFYVSFVVNPLAGADDFSMTYYNANGFDIQKIKDNYWLLNMGVGIKYRLNLSKSNLQKHCLIFAVGDLISCKYVYKNTNTATVVRYNPLQNYTNSSSYLFSPYNRIDHNSFRFPVYLKLSYCKKRIAFSLTQYLFSHESMYYGSGFFERFYTNFNIGLTL